MAEFFYQRISEDGRKIHFHRLIPKDNGKIRGSYVANTVTYVKNGDENQETWRFQDRVSNEYETQYLIKWLSEVKKTALPSDPKERLEIISKIERELGIQGIEENLAFVC